MFFNPWNNSWIFSNLFIYFRLEAERKAEPAADGKVEAEEEADAKAEAKPKTEPDQKALLETEAEEKTRLESEIQAKVLYFCVGFRELTHITRDLPQAVKKINVDSSWANLQNDIYFAQNGRSCHFEWE